MAEKKQTKAGTKKTTATKQKPAPKKKPVAKKKTASLKKTPTTKKVKVEKEVKQEKEQKMKAETKQSDSSTILADKIWRLMAMIAFAFIGYFALLVIVVLSAMQFVVVLLNDETNSEIKVFTDRLSKFCNQIFSFLSYKSEEMPFPFAQFPDK